MHHGAIGSFGGNGRKIIVRAGNRDQRQKGLGYRGMISVDQRQAGPSGTLIIVSDGGRISELRSKPGRKPLDHSLESISQVLEFKGEPQRSILTVQSSGNPRPDF